MTTRTARPLGTVLDLLVACNPLLAHGPRTHGTGIELDQPALRARRDVDAPRVHLGHAGR